MAKNIDESVREHLKILCYEIALGGMIDSQTRSEVKLTVEKYLNNNGYSIELVKCDEENNPPELIDSNQMKVEIFEFIIPSSSEIKIHTLIL